MENREYLGYLCDDAQPLQKVLPLIIDKILQQGRRCVMFVDDLAKAAFWDQVLWTFQPTSFLPHGAEGTSQVPAASCPVWITTSLANPNGSDFLVFNSQSSLPSEASGLPALFSSFVWIGYGPDHDFWSQAVKYKQMVPWKKEAFWVFQKKWQNYSWEEGLSER